MRRELLDRFSAETFAQLGVITVILLTATRAAGEPPAAPQPQTARRSLTWDGMYVGGHVGYARGAASTSGKTHLQRIGPAAGDHNDEDLETATTRRWPSP